MAYTTIGTLYNDNDNYIDMHNRRAQNKHDTYTIKNCLANATNAELAIAKAV